MQKVVLGDEDKVTCYEKKVSSESFKALAENDLEHYLEIKDLTDPQNGVHAINLVIERLKEFFQAVNGFPPVEVRRGERIVNVTDEFDNLYIPLNSPQRLPRYSRYINETTLLRTHTTPLIPHILKEVKQKNILDGLFFLPGICYRRTTLDKQRVGEPHKMDIFRVKKSKQRFNKNDLIEFIEVVLKGTGAGTKYRTSETAHPYTKNGLAVEVEIASGSWLKLFECGEISDQLLQDAALDVSEYSGLALGLGLERLVMHIKKIDDIRLLRAQNPLIRNQMLDLAIYEPVVCGAAICHDFTVTLACEYQKEDICEILMEVVKPNVDVLEKAEILEEVPLVNELNEKPQLKKVVLRVTFNSVERVLDANEVNMFIDRIYNILRGEL